MHGARKKRTVWNFHTLELKHLGCKLWKPGNQNICCLSHIYSLHSIGGWGWRVTSGGGGGGGCDGGDDSGDDSGDNSADDASGDDASGDDDSGDDDSGDDGGDDHGVDSGDDSI